MGSARYLFPPGYFEQIYGNDSGIRQTPKVMPAPMPNQTKGEYMFQKNCNERGAAGGVPFGNKKRDTFVTNPYPNDGVIAQAQPTPPFCNQQLGPPTGDYQRRKQADGRNAGYAQNHAANFHALQDTYTFATQYMPSHQYQAHVYGQGVHQWKNASVQQFEARGIPPVKANGVLHQAQPPRVIPVVRYNEKMEAENRERLRSQAAVDRIIQKAQTKTNFKQTVRQRMEGSKVSLNGRKFTVVEILELPADGVSGMNEGIRVLKDPHGVIFVEKKLKMGSIDRRERSQAEKKALNQITKAGGSPNVNKIYEAFWEPGSASSSLILEYCNRGNLDKVIETYRDSGVKIPEKDCFKTMYDLASALCMIHLGIKDPLDPSDKVKDWNTICHLDIKPQNIFLDYQGPSYLENSTDTWPRVVLGDFGCSVTREDIMSRKVDHKKQPYGTSGWYPPESDANDKGHLSENGQNVKNAYGKFSDIWQMGAVIQVMCLRAITPTMHWVDKKCGAGHRYSPDMNEAVNKCMVRNIDLRPTALDVATAIKGLMDSRGY